MRVLVTGAAGFVGSHVLEAFREHDVIGVDTREAPGVQQWNGHLPDTDLIVSLAATADPRAAISAPVQAYENNVRVMVKTLEHARHTGARVLHVSTNEVYGLGSCLPYRPRGPYAGGKACQEIICESYPDVPSTIVVTQSLFGERQQPDKLVPTVIRNLMGNVPVRLQRGRDGWAARPFLHVENLADALLHLAGRKKTASRVHVGADGAISVEQVAQALADQLGRELRLKGVPAGDRAGHESTVALIGNDIPGWKPVLGAEDGLARTARWYEENPEWL
jgi:nucleoside-diphosphate-sugar epimerase